LSKLSLVIPLYNEAQNLTPLVEAICKAMDPQIFDLEMIFVDDGSNDGTFSKLKDIATEDSRIKIIRFSRNFGQTAAI